MTVDHSDGAKVRLISLNCPIDGGDVRRRSISLTGSAKLNGLDPEAYLRAVLTHIAEHPVEIR